MYNLDSINKKYMHALPKRYIGLSYGVDKYTRTGPLEALFPASAYVRDKITAVEQIASIFPSDSDILGCCHSWQGFLVEADIEKIKAIPVGEANIGVGVFVDENLMIFDTLDSWEDEITDISDFGDRFHDGWSAHKGIKHDANISFAFCRVNHLEYVRLFKEDMILEKLYADKVEGWQSSQKI